MAFPGSDKPVSDEEMASLRAGETANPVVLVYVDAGDTGEETRTHAPNLDVI